MEWLQDLERTLHRALVELRGPALAARGGGINGAIQIDTSKIGVRADGSYAGPLRLSLERLSRANEDRYLTGPRRVMEWLPSTVRTIAETGSLCGGWAEVVIGGDADYAEESIDGHRAMTLRVALPVRIRPLA